VDPNADLVDQTNISDLLLIYLYFSAHFKELLGIENISLGFQDHRESMRSNKSWGGETKYEV
jgi:hypothetical protein